MPEEPDSLWFYVRHPNGCISLMGGLELNLELASMAGIVNAVVVSISEHGRRLEAALEGAQLHPKQTLRVSFELGISAGWSASWCCRSRKASCRKTKWYELQRSRKHFMHPQSAAVIRC